jgi:hypothetical protein
MSEQYFSKVREPINFKIIAGICIVAAAYQAYLFVDPTTDEIELVDFTYSLGAVACGIASLFVAKHYWGSTVLARAYVALGIAFLALFVGDMIYNYYNLVLNEDPYPSPADFFFVVFGVFAVTHLIINIHYFKRTFSVLTTIWLVTLPMAVIVTYSYFGFAQLQGETPFVFFYGMVFVISTTVILAFAILGASIFRHSALRTTWLLLAVGIFIYTLADVWYYHIELFDLYDGNHPTNTLWVLSFMVVLYALYKHTKAL